MNEFNPTANSNTGSPMTEANEDTHVVDVDSISAASRELIPNGWYTATFEDFDYALSQRSGEPMWSSKLTIDDGPYAERTQYYHFSWAPKAAPFTKAVIEKCFPDLFTNPSYRTPAGKFNVKAVGDDSALVGRKVQIKVGTQTYEGEKRNSVKDMRPVHGSASTPGANEFLGA